MTNNTTSYGGDFTIKPLTTSIDIITERQLIASWTRAGLTDGQIRKMLMLYLGEPAWMNLEKMYTCNMFNNIAEGLKFHSKSDFIEILIRCKGFGFVWKDDSALHNMKNLLAFYTPIWHQPAEGEMENMQDSQENMQSGGCYNIININKKKNIKKKNISPYTSGSQVARIDNKTAEQTAAASSQNLAEYQQLVETTARNLIAYVATAPDAYANVVKPIDEFTSKEINGLYTDPDAACPANKATACFFNNYVFPYILKNSKRMMTISSLEGQSHWLKNLINLEFMSKNLMRAIADTRKELEQNPQEMQRQNRPLSKFEYQDKASGQRFYDAPSQQNGALVQYRIPADAPPRPSALAIWNKFSHSWMTPKT